MEQFKLTEQQLSFFETFGYLSFPGLLADRIEEIDREFEAVWEANGGGITANRMMGKPVPASPSLLAKANGSAHCWTTRGSSASPLAC